MLQLIARLVQNLTERLLQAVAGRLTDGIRGADTACRYGGDEFLIMLPDVDNARIAAAVWAKLKMALGEPYFIDGFEIRLTCSMGAVVYPTDGQTDEELIRMADCALYRAKDRSGDASINALPIETWEEAEAGDLAIVQQPG